MVSFIYPHLPIDTIVRLSHPQSRDIQGQETFLEPSADKKTFNFKTESLNHDPSQST